MRLTRAQISVLKQVRDMMQDGEGTQYICVNIQKVIAKRFRTEDVTEHLIAMKMSDSLCDAITKGLNADGNLNNTVFGYLRKHVPGFSSNPRRVQMYHAQLARLAWLDKMIETKKIAPA